jgi:hypothetical protein
MRAFTWPMRRPSAIASFGKSGGSRNCLQSGRCRGTGAAVDGAAAASCTGVSVRGLGLPSAADWRQPAATRRLTVLQQAGRIDSNRRWRGGR